MSLLLLALLMSVCYWVVEKTCFTWWKLIDLPIWKIEGKLICVRKGVKSSVNMSN